MAKDETIRLAVMAQALTLQAEAAARLGSIIEGLAHAAADDPDDAMPPDYDPETMAIEDAPFTLIRRDELARLRGVDAAWEGVDRSFLTTQARTIDALGRALVRALDSPIDGDAARVVADYLFPHGEPNEDGELTFAASRLLDREGRDHDDVGFSGACDMVVAVLTRLGVPEVETGLPYGAPVPSKTPAA